MPPHLASLVHRARIIRRQIWASLPFGYRLAHVFRVLSSSYLQEWGRALGALLLREGIEGMPDPGPRWDPEKADPRRLPTDYLEQEAGRIYNSTLRILGNPEAVQDMMQDVLMKLYTSSELKGGFSQVMSYVTTKVLWAAKSWARQQRQRQQHMPQESLVDTEGETRDLEDTRFMLNPHFVEDPRAYARLEELFGQGQWERKVIPELARIHPDLPLFFEKLLDDPGQGMKQVMLELPHYSNSYQNWLKMLRQKVAPKLRALAEAA